MQDVAIAELLAGLGLRGADAALARAVLEDAGVTNPRKSRIAESKVAAATAVIDARIARLCRRCAESPSDARVVAAVDAAFCARCGGSANVRALDELAEAARRAGAMRLVVVGGSPDVRRELGRLS